MKRTLNSRDAARDAIRQMAGRGYKHEDLSFRHVGFYSKINNTGKLYIYAIFIDLSRVISVAENDEEVVEEMEMKLGLSDKN